MIFPNKLLKTFCVLVSPSTTDSTAPSQSVSVFFFFDRCFSTPGTNDRASVRTAAAGHALWVCNCRPALDTVGKHWSFLHNIHCKVIESSVLRRGRSRVRLCLRTFFKGDWRKKALKFLVPSFFLQQSWHLLAARSGSPREKWGLDRLHLCSYPLWPFWEAEKAKIWLKFVMVGWSSSPPNVRTTRKKSGDKQMGCISCAHVGAVQKHISLKMWNLWRGKKCCASSASWFNLTVST